MKNFLLCSAIGLVLALQPAGLWALTDQDCLDCHSLADEVGEMNHVDAAIYQGTAHAELGCSGCHSAGDGHPYDASEVSLTAQCSDCHDGLAATYAASSHADNASCGDCHNAHQALAPLSLSGEQMNQSCQDCHDHAEVEGSHARWLPQADIHIRAVPCVTCHSSSKKFVVSLYVTQRQGGRAYADYELISYTDLQQAVGSEDVTDLLDQDNDGQVSLTELNAFYQRTDNHGLRLWAMMTPESVDHDFTTMDDRWDCTYCHAAGPEAMQQSFIAFPQPDGTYGRVPVEAGATLDALFGTPDFYMVGSTRSTTLNIIGLLILLGGLAMPIGHGTLRFLTRKNRRKDH
ncbi:cytochrome c3 family protein [Desulfuromonas thiophila]|uniref:Doubled CXXCH motif (Paired_CXXCH_1) n=1 Tax=Desulfuromonas thiophila TaxID=57664 RepID=A0A1G6XPT0_9BACT|nr:cytochrome c3 family protein [Desulfuromonas thiophila]MDD3801134.1 cytochrome c3 family protein [Desulfuromonas thiophila]SDD79377.1 Doubled CXXCH motif (Paired_CXXCH_1) [Desulfuromonas thiophila]